jgi:PAS domain S-box-containing protein
MCLAAIGLLGLFGWAAGMRWLVAPLPALAPMRPVSAVGMLALAGAMGLNTWRGGGRAGRLAARGLAVGVAALGLLAVVEHAAGRPFGPARVLFAAEVAAYRPPVPATPSLIVGIMFVIVGLALALRTSARPRTYSTLVLEAGSATLALSAAVAIVDDLTQQRLPDGPLQVGPLTVAAMLALTLGLLLSRPDGLWARRFAGSGPGPTLLRRVVPVLLVPPLVDAVSRVVGGDGLAGAPGVVLTLSTTLVVLLLVGAIAATANRLEEDERQREALLATVSEQRRRARSVLDALHDGVAVVDHELRMVEVNPRYCQILGRRAEEILGVGPPYPWWGEVDGADQRVEQLRKVLAGELPGLAYEQSIVRADGSRLAELVTIAPVLDADGRVIELVGSFTDINERVRADDLQRRVEQLQRLDSLGKLAGGVAHDFNNLLVVIGGHARILSNKLPADTPLWQGAQRIVEAAAKGDALTRQMLTFARGTSRGGVAVDLGQVLTGVQALLAATLGESIVLRMPEPGACAGFRVAADQGQMEQVLINLAANARDAMPDGGTLTIECGRVAAPPDPTGPAGDDRAEWIRLTVSDTGLGMDAETVSRVFDPFFTTKPVGQGTGLGLSSVYGIVSKAGGQITVQSRPGAGSRFHIHLPATAEPVLAEPDRITMSALPPHARVLVVEDQNEVIELVTTVLREAGLTIDPFTEGARAVAAVAQGLAPDLLLTDVIMPGLSGPELAAQVRAHRPGLPVVYMSGYTADALNTVDLTAGVMLLAKPFTPEQLLAAVARSLRVGAPGPERAR